MIGQLLTALPTDFNSLRSGLATVSRRFFTISWYDLVPGVNVALYDHDGNQCLGIVEQVDERVLRIRPLWKTWIAGPSPEAAFTYSYDTASAAPHTIGGSRLLSQTGGVQDIRLGVV